MSCKLAMGHWLHNLTAYAVRGRGGLRMAMLLLLVSSMGEGIAVILFAGVMSNKIILLKQFVGRLLHAIPNVTDRPSV